MAKVLPVESEGALPRAERMRGDLARSPGSPLDRSRKPRCRVAPRDGP